MARPVAIDLLPPAPISAPKGTAAARTAAARANAGDGDFRATLRQAQQSSSTARSRRTTSSNNSNRTNSPRDDAPVNDANSNQHAAAADGRDTAQPRVNGGTTTDATAKTEPTSVADTKQPDHGDKNDAPADAGSAALSAAAVQAVAAQPVTVVDANTSQPSDGESAPVVVGDVNALPKHTDNDVHAGRQTDSSTAPKHVATQQADVGNLAAALVAKQPTQVDSVHVSASAAPATAERSPKPVATVADGHEEQSADSSSDENKAALASRHEPVNAKPAAEARAPHEARPEAAKSPHAQGNANDPTPGLAVQKLDARQLRLNAANERGQAGAPSVRPAESLPVSATVVAPVQAAVAELTSAVDHDTRGEAEPVARVTTAQPHAPTQSPTHTTATPTDAATGVNATSAATPRDALARTLSTSDPLPVPLDRLTDVVRTNIADNRWHVSLQLDPPELGRVRLDVSMQDSGLSVRMQVGSESVRRMVESRLPDLVHALGDQDMRVSHTQVSVRETSNGSTDAQHQHQESGARASQDQSANRQQGSFGERGSNERSSSHADFSGRATTDTRRGVQQRIDIDGRRLDLVA